MRLKSSSIVTAFLKLVLVVIEHIFSSEGFKVWRVNFCSIRYTIKSINYIGMHILCCNNLGVIGYKKNVIKSTDLNDLYNPPIKFGSTLDMSWSSLPSLPC